MTETNERKGKAFEKTMFFVPPTENSICFLKKINLKIMTFSQVRQTDRQTDSQSVIEDGSNQSQSSGPAGMSEVVMTVMTPQEKALLLRDVMRCWHEFLAGPLRTDSSTRRKDMWHTTRQSAIAHKYQF